MTLVQQASGNTGGANYTTVTLAASPLARSSLLGWAVSNGPTVSSITGGGAAWSQLASIPVGGFTLELWEGYNASGSGSNVITVNWSASITAAAHVSEWTSLAQPSSVEALISQFGTGSTAAPGAIAPVNAGDLLALAVASITATVNADPAGWTRLNSAGAPPFTLQPYYILPSGTTLRNPSAGLNSSNSWIAAAVTIPPAAAFIAPPTPDATGAGVYGSPDGKYYAVTSPTRQNGSWYVVAVAATPALAQQSAINVITNTPSGSLSGTTLLNYTAAGIPIQTLLGNLQVLTRPRAAALVGHRGLVGF